MAMLQLWSNRYTDIGGLMGGLDLNVMKNQILSSPVLIYSINPRNTRSNNAFRVERVKKKKIIYNNTQ